MNKEIKLEEYSNNQVKIAGKTLTKEKENIYALNILSYFRTDHEIPLDNALTLIKKYLNDENTLVAKRLKRTPSIINKLILSKEKGLSSQLSTMQDIGGCRVVFNTLRSVEKFVKNILSEKTFELKHDYIRNPKENGYRSIHLVGKFDNGYGKKRIIELQVRTNIQHSWATAVEIVDLFTKESIKSSTGSKDWTDFFSLVSKQFEVLERNPYLNSSNKKLLVEHFRKEMNNSKSNELNKAIFGVFVLSKKLDIHEKFCSYRDSVSVMAEAIHQISDGYFLIAMEFDNSDTKIKISLFPSEELSKATDKYLELEKISLSNDNYICALVSTMSVGGIEKAYPNYFADSTKFIEYLELFNSNFEHNPEVQKNISAILLEQLLEKQDPIKSNLFKNSTYAKSMISELSTEVENIYSTKHLDKLLKK